MFVYREWLPQVCFREVDSEGRKEGRKGTRLGRVRPLKKKFFLRLFPIHFGNENEHFVFQICEVNRLKMHLIALVYNSLIRIRLDI